VKALRYGPTTLTEDRKLFKPDTLHIFPKVSDWLDDPDSKYDSKFGSMTLKAFRQYLVDETRARSEKYRMKKGKQNARVMNDDDEEQLSSDSTAHVIRKGKARHIDSDELDG
jgi:hypothetical protein